MNWSGMPWMAYEYCTVVWPARGERSYCLIAALTISTQWPQQNNQPILFCKMLRKILKNLLNPDFLIAGLHGYLVSPTLLLLKVFLGDAENLSRYLVPPNHSDWNLSRSSPVFMLSPQFADKYDKIWFITLSGETCAIHQIGGRGLLQSKRGSNHAKVTIAFATI